MLDMLILAESELFVGISVSTYSWYLREMRCIEVGSRGAWSMQCSCTSPHAGLRVSGRCNSSMPASANSPVVMGCQMGSLAMHYGCCVFSTLTMCAGQGFGDHRHD